jgi:hypothetical protein
MPVQWREMPAGQYIVIEFSDPFTTPESERAMREIFTRRDGRGALRLFVDVRDSAPPDAPFVHTAAAFFRRHVAELEGARIAVIVATDAQFGMARMSEIVTEQLPLRIRAFREAAAAEEWLRLE